MSKSDKNNPSRKQRVTYYHTEKLSGDNFGMSSVPSKAVRNYEKLNKRLIDSIPDGDITYMKRLLNMGADSNATYRLNHVSLCHIAALHDNGALALLLKLGADCSRSDKHGRTPLHVAAWAGNVNQITLLLNLKDWRSSVRYDLILPETLEEVRRQCVPLNEFINKQIQPNEVSTLLDEQGDGADHTHRDVMDVLPVFQKGWTALHAASARAQHHCVQLLLAAGADASAQGLCCRTPLDVAGCAHYTGHRIDVNNFMETVDLLLKAGGQFLKYGDNDNVCFDTPLHTAVELGSEAAVKLLLKGGASATEWNSRGLTAMHVCVEKRNKELLQLLTSHNETNQSLATVDWKDQSGSTVLCASVKAGWIEGVHIALDAGATNIKVNAQSPIHYIAEQLESIGKLHDANPLTNDRNLDMHKKFLNAAEKISLKEDTHVINLAAALGAKDVLEHLLHNSNAKILLNKCDCFGSPLYYALIYNRIDCARLLIDNKAAVGTIDCYNINCNKKSGTKTSLLHIAAIMNHYEIAEIIIEHDKKTVHADVEGRLPLDEACSWYGHKKMIALLLRNGADLSGSENETTHFFSDQRKLVPIENLMNNVPEPTKFLEEIFNSCITIIKEEVDDCKIEVDFQVLVPKSDNKQMRVIQALLDTGNRYNQQDLLIHPLVDCFLYLKWRSVLFAFIIIFILNWSFMCCIHVVVLSLFCFTPDKKTIALPNLNVRVLLLIIYLSGALIFIKEIFITIKMKNRIPIIELSVKYLSIGFAFILPAFSSWDLKPDSEWVRFCWSVTLFLAYTRMMYLLSGLPLYGYYVVMYRKVATRVFKIILSFFYLINVFAVSFAMQLHEKPQFEDIWTSILSTLVMMTQEMGYFEIMKEASAEQVSASTIIIRITFLMFLMFVSIVLLNLIIGVAVKDVNELEVSGDKESLLRLVEFITVFEDIYLMISYNWLNTIKWKNRIILQPGHKRRDNNCLPPFLLDAIFEQARLQKRESDEEQHTLLYDMKQHEMHNVMVNKDAETSKSEDLYNVLNKLIEDIEMIKKLIAKNNVAIRDSSQDDSDC